MLQAIYRHERLVVTGALALVTAAAWTCTLQGVGMTGGAIEMTAMAPATWSPAYAGAVFLMWCVMMIAMMLPSASPMILLYAAIQRKRAAPRADYLSTVLFAAGYLAVWAGFGSTASLAQGALQLTGLLTPMLDIAGSPLAGGMLIAAGLYQFTPLKHACLSHCRSPLHFITRRWRPGRAGAFRMGVEHGVYCVGCCWFLMGLLFVGGVMNPFWIGAIALYILVEKLAPRGRWMSYAAGLALTVWGVGVLLASVW